MIFFNENLFLFLLSDVLIIFCEIVGYISSHAGISPHLVIYSNCNSLTLSGCRKIIVMLKIAQAAFTKVIRVRQWRIDQ